MKFHELIGRLFSRVRLDVPASYSSATTARAKRVDGYTPTAADTQALADATFKRQRKNNARAHR